MNMLIIFYCYFCYLLINFNGFGACAVSSTNSVAGMNHHLRKNMRGRGSISGPSPDLPATLINHLTMVKKAGSDANLRRNGSGRSSSQSGFFGSISKRQELKIRAQELAATFNSKVTSGLKKDESKDSIKSETNSVKQIRVEVHNQSGHEDVVSKVDSKPKKKEKLRRLIKKQEIWTVDLSIGEEGVRL